MNAVAGKPKRAQRWRNALSCAGCLFFLVVAALFAATTLCAIVNFGLRQPMFDQWREYETLLGLPFPQDLVQLDNGHRPIVPNLIRVAEIRWFGANQILQLTIGTICAYLTALILAAAAWREREQPEIARAIGAMLAVLGMLWLGNARRLLHGSESLHGYLPTLAAIFACVCILRADARRSLAWTWAACLACVVATFSFGVGLASFSAILAIMLLQRMPWRWLAIPALALIACLVLYVYVLPGNQGVRSQIDLDPLAGTRIVLEWIASPWVNGWLHYASQISGPPPPGADSWMNQTVRVSATAVVAAFRGDLHPPAALLGLAGVTIFCCWLAVAMLRRRQFGQAELLAIGAATYALAAAVLTSFSRVEAFNEHPDQTFAPRYMTWPCLFWACLALLALFRYARSPSMIVRGGGVVIFALLPSALWVAQKDEAIWGALVFRGAQQTASQLRSGTYLPGHFPAERLGPEIERREIALLRRDRLAMFLDGAWQQVGRRWTGTLRPADRIAADVHWLEPAVDDSGHPVGHFEGWITTGIRPAQRGGQLVLLDADDVVAGLAEYSFISPVSDSLILRLPRKRGFDGYVPPSMPPGPYRLAVADFASGQALLIGSLPTDTRISGEPQSTGISHGSNADILPAGR
jgi:hypothetical protein